MRLIDDSVPRAITRMGNMLLVLAFGVALVPWFVGDAPRPVGQVAITTFGTGFALTLGGDLLEHRFNTTKLGFAVLFILLLVVLLPVYACGC